MRPSLALLGAEVESIEPIPIAADSDSALSIDLYWLGVRVWFAGERSERYRLLICVVPDDQVSRSKAELSGVPDGVIGTIMLGDEAYLVAEALSVEEVAGVAVRSIFPSIEFTTAVADSSGGAAAVVTLMDVAVDQESVPDRSGRLQIGHRQHSRKQTTGSQRAECLIVKLFRRVDSDPNPDLEVVSAFAAANVPGASDAVALLHDPEPISSMDDESDTPTAGCAAVRAFVRPTPIVRGDGVAMYVQAVGELFARRCAPPDLRFDAVRPMRDIGTAIAEFHLASARVFGAEPADGDTWTTTMMSHIERKASSNVDLTALESVLGRLNMATDLGSSIRVHSHLHLGNVAFAGRRWNVVNFEGDGRPFAEVRARSSPLQDLSRAISSIELVGSSLLTQFGEDDEERNRELVVLLESLEQRVIDALIDGYGRPEGIEALLPATSDSRDALLAVFEVHHRIEAALPDPEDAPWSRALGSLVEDVPEQ